MRGASVWEKFFYLPSPAPPEDALPEDGADALSEDGIEALPVEGAGVVGVFPAGIPPVGVGAVVTAPAVAARHWNHQPERSVSQGA